MKREQSIVSAALAVILSISMLASVLPITVSADETRGNGGGGGTSWGDENKEMPVGDIPAFEATGDGTEDNPWQISDIDSLYAFAAKVNTDKNGFDYTDCHIELTADITMPDNVVWRGVQDFNGTLDGNGHTIKNMTISSGDDSTNIGFIKNISKDASFSNLNFKNINLYLHTNPYAGILAGEAKKIAIDHCNIEGTISFANDKNDSYTATAFGGYVGLVANRCDISDSNYSGQITTDKRDRESVGGLVGQANASCTISGCSVKGSIQAQGTNTGGLVGWVNDNALKVTDCRNLASVSANMYAGGILGRYNMSPVDHTEVTVYEIARCANDGEVSAEVAGGIQGGTDGTINIRECVNRGKISGNQYAGGICGYLYAKGCAAPEISNCYSTGGVQSSSDRAAGIVGILASASMCQSSITNCYVNPADKNMNYGIAGRLGFTGWSYTGSTFTNIYYPEGFSANPDPEYTSDWFYINNVVAFDGFDMIDQDSFVGFDFERIWKMTSRGPVFAWEERSDTPSKPEGFKMVHSLPSIKDERKARAFLCFIFNDNRYDEILTDNPYLQLIMGTYEGTDEEKFILAFGLVQMIDSTILNNIESADINQQKSMDALSMYLEKKYGTSEDYVKEAWKEEQKNLIQLILLGTKSGEWITNNIPLDWITKYYSIVKGAWGKKDTYKKFIEDLALGISSLGVIMQSEYKGRYTYFDQYIKIRDLFSPTDDPDEFELLIAFAGFSSADSTYFSKLIPYITLGQYQDWTDSISLINEWAEYTWQLKQAVYHNDSDEVDKPTFQKYTMNQIQCPVDVDVLSPEGTLIARISNNKIVQEIPIEYRDQIYILVVGDAKYVCVNDGVQCKIKMSATDDGIMNYSSSLVEYGTEKIINNTFNVPLTRGKVYSVNYKTQTDAETSYARISQFTIESQTEMETYNISVKIKGTGKVLGSGNYRRGTNVHLMAIATEDDPFIRWESADGRKLSDEENLQFTANENENIIAIFQSGNVNEIQNPPDGISGGKGEIIGTTTAMEYRTTDKEDAEWQTCGDDLTQVDPGNYEVRYAAKDNFGASKSVRITVLPKDEEENQNKQNPPEGIIGSKGAIEGTTSKMEYRLIGSNKWIICNDGFTSVKPGDYEVRYAATEDKETSESVQVTVLSNEKQDSDNGKDDTDKKNNGCVNDSLIGTAKNGRQAIQHHTHRYEWKTVREATEDQNGEADYLCVECGDVAYRSPISSFYIYNQNVAKNIRSCAKNGTVNVDATKRDWISFSSMFSQALQERSDVTVVLRYNYGAGTCKMTIPAGSYKTVQELFDKDGTKDKNGHGLFCGYLNLATKFPVIQMK